jgi:hypothetical protein
MKFKIIFAPVKTDKTDPIVDAAKDAGATALPVQRLYLHAVPACTRQRPFSV